MTVLVEGRNGNTHIVLHQDGSREVSFPDSGMELDFPLNVDIRLSSRCRFGLNPVTQRSVCDFCHESARTDGQEGDVAGLAYRLSMLPKTTEIAVGINEVSDGMIDFLTRMRTLGYIVNGTINQGLVQTQEHERVLDLLYGVGVSFRTMDWNTTDQVYQQPNTVLHVIAGIDDFSVVKKMTERVGKILVLGEKDFGFNSGRVDLKSQRHLEWYRGIHELFDLATVSFDNLAIEQLGIRRFFREDSWVTFYQGERSMYIDAVSGHYMPSSRSDDRTDWRMSIEDYYARIK